MQRSINCYISLFCTVISDPVNKTHSGIAILTPNSSVVFAGVSFCERNLFLNERIRIYFYRTSNLNEQAITDLKVSRSRKTTLEFLLRFSE